MSKSPIAGALARLRSLWRGVRGHQALHAEMDAEFRHHMELRARDLERTGLAPAEALRRARLEFGSTERYKEEGRRSRGLRQVDRIHVSWLDFKLGFRMLAKYPGLSLVGGLAMAFAIWMGAGTFEIASQLLRPSLPLPEGDRVVALRTWDAEANRVERRALYDYGFWRAELKSVRDPGAFRTLERNLITGEGRGEPVEVAEVSASAFRLVRVRPLLGRPLVDADERPGAPAVVVIGYDVWRRRFGGDRGVVGSTVRLGSEPTTVVGVMPEGFGFPVAQSLWMPLRLGAAAVRPREGPALSFFARLAPGVSLAEAQAELTTLGRRAAAASPETHARLRPQVLPYAKAVLDLGTTGRWSAASINLPVIMLLVLVCANVALLMFARAASRESEIIVRSALGATRGRIITQLFAEALVLGGLSALVGLTVAGAGLRWVFRIVEGELLKGTRLPFWFAPSLSPTTVLYAVLLTLLGAMIAGVVPGLKVTRGLGARLRQTTAGGGGLRFGGIWTVVIVAQVAVTVAFPVTAWAVRRDARQITSVDVGFPANEYLSVRLEIDRDPDPAGGVAADTSRAAFRARYRAAYQRLERRLAAEPAVAGIAFADRLPRMYHPYRLVEVDAGGAAPLLPEYPAYRVSSAAVDPAFFDALGAPALAGRLFTPADYAVDRGDPSDSTARGGPVIVNESFVKNVLGGRNPIGRRLRYRLFEESDTPRTLRDSHAWYDIVGVVRDMGMGVAPDPKVAGIYHPVAPGDAYPGTVAVHVRGSALAFAPRLRALATASDPTLRLYDAMPLDRINDSELEFLDFWFRMLLGVSAMALTLSLAGVYAVMSFTVARRTREIGIRVALGADRRRVILSVFRRPLTQVSAGIVVGAALVGVLLAGAEGGALSAKQVALLAGYAGSMLLVCLLACVVPTRRALAVQPTEALRAE